MTPPRTASGWAVCVGVEVFVDGLCHCVWQPGQPSEVVRVVARLRGGDLEVVQITPIQRAQLEFRTLLERDELGDLRGDPAGVTPPALDLCGVALLTLRSRGATRAPFGGVVALAFTLGAATVTIGAIWVQPVASLVGTLLVLAGTFFRPRRASR